LTKALRALSVEYEQGQRQVEQLSEQLTRLDRNYRMLAETLRGRTRP